MKISLIAVAILAAAPMFANAYTITSKNCGGGHTQCTDVWSDAYVSPTLISKNDGSVLNDALSWSFDLTKSGFVTGKDSVFNYSLVLNFSDDTECVKSGRKGCTKYGYDLEQEWTSVTEGGKTFKFEVDPGIESFKGTVSGIAELNSSGKLLVSLNGIRGDFYFLDGLLEACGTKGESTSVPEPSSIALLAAGLLGIAAMRRKNA